MPSGPVALDGILSFCIITHTNSPVPFSQLSGDDKNSQKQMDCVWIFFSTIGEGPLSLFQQIRLPATLGGKKKQNTERE